MNKHLKICSYGAELWPSIEWASETDEEYLTQCCFYAEKAEPDDAPDCLSMCARESGFSITKQHTSNFLAAWSW
jgi:hypothetical protein